MCLTAGALECARLLLSWGADATLWDRRQESTPLHLAAGCTAASQTSVTMMALLLNNRGDINAGLELDGGGSVLHSAVRANNIGAVRFLLDNKVQTVTKKFSGRLLNNFRTVHSHLLQN